MFFLHFPEWQCNSFSFGAVDGLISRNWLSYAISSDFNSPRSYTIWFSEGILTKGVWSLSFCLIFHLLSIIPTFFLTTFHKAWFKFSDKLFKGAPWSKIPYFILSPLQGNRTQNVVFLKKVGWWAVSWISVIVVHNC
jgi:hypothetical protein